MEPSQYQRDLELNRLRLKKEKWTRDQPQGRVGIVQVLNPDETVDLLYLFDARASGEECDQPAYGDTVRDAISSRELVVANPRTMIPYEDGRALALRLVDSVRHALTQHSYSVEADRLKAQLFLSQPTERVQETIVEVRMGEAIVVNHHDGRETRGNITITYRHLLSNRLQQVRILGHLDNVVCDEFARLYQVFLYYNPQGERRVLSEGQPTFVIAERAPNKKVALRVVSPPPARPESTMQITRREYRHLVKEVSRLQSRLNTTQKTLEDVVRRLDQLTGAQP